MMLKRLWRKMFPVRDSNKRARPEVTVEQIPDSDGVPTYMTHWREVCDF